MIASSGKPIMFKLIEIKELHKVYANGTEALGNVSLSIKEGERIGLIGPNGAGKTTLVKLILGILRPTSGSVRLWGKDPYEMPKDLRKVVGFLLEDRGLYERLTVKENMMLWAKLLNIDRKKVLAALEKCDLWEERETLVKELSAGMRRKLAIAKSIAHDPSLIVLDEPTSNLDPLARRELIDLLRGFNKTIFLTSHDLFDVEGICDRIILIRHGNIAFDGSVQDFKKGLEVSEGTEIEISGRIPQMIEKLISDKFGGQTIRGRGVVVLKDTDSKELVRFLAENGFDIKRVEEKKVILEDMYYTIVQEDEE